MKTSIPVGTDGYGSLGVRWGASGGNMSINAEPWENNVKHRVRRCACTISNGAFASGGRFPEKADGYWKLHQKPCENKAKSVFLRGADGYGSLVILIYCTYGSRKRFPESANGYRESIGKRCKTKENQQKRQGRERQYFLENYGFLTRYGCPPLHGRMQYAMRQS